MNWTRKTGRGLAVIAAALVVSACSGNDVEEISCESSEECPDGMYCADAVCVEGEDPELNQENQEDPNLIEDEDYLVSYWGRRPANLPGRDAIVRAIGSQEGSAQDLLPAGVECVDVDDCGFTSDFGHFVKIRSTGNAFEVLVAPVDKEAMSVGSLQVMVEDVHNPRLRGNGVIYDVIDGDTFYGYYQEVGSSSAQRVARLSSTTAQVGRYWDADPAANRAVVYVPTLETVNIWIGTISGGVDNSNDVILFDRENFPGTAGSFYIGQLPTGFSEDGRFMAVSTVAPNAHNACVTNDDCPGTSHVCGTNDRCVAIEATIHVFDMDHRRSLGDACNAHSQCGPVHRCDSPHEDLSEGFCKPQRIVMGPPNTPSQQGQSGCQASRADGSYSFTNVRGPFSFARDGKLYFVGSRECVRGTPTGDDTEANIPRTAIIAADLGTGALEEVYGNAIGEDFSDARCTDEIEGTVDTRDCVTVINRVTLSPDHNDLVFLATNPTVYQATLAARVFDVWRVRRDGEDHQWLGETQQSHLIDNLRVHRKAE